MTGGGECSICAERLEENLAALVCGHIFHYSCVLPWVQDNRSCPICRQEQAVECVIKLYTECLFRRRNSEKSNNNKLVQKLNEAKKANKKLTRQLEEAEELIKDLTDRLEIEESNTNHLQDNDHPESSSNVSKDELILKLKDTQKRLDQAIKEKAQAQKIADNYRTDLNALLDRCHDYEEHLSSYRRRDDVMRNKMAPF